MAAHEGSKDVDEITAAHGGPSGISTPTESSDLDDNYHLYKRSDEQEIDPAESKRVLRKLDARLVPILFLIYLLQYLDKNGINYASVYGLQKGTHLQGQDYSWLGSIFYFGKAASIVNANKHSFVVQVTSGLNIRLGTYSNDYG